MNSNFETNLWVQIGKASVDMFGSVECLMYFKNGPQRKNIVVINCSGKKGKNKFLFLLQTVTRTVLNFTFLTMILSD